MKKKKKASENPKFFENLDRIKKSIEKFQKRFKKMPEDMGVMFTVSVVSDREVITDTVRYVNNELSINVANFEKKIIFEKLSKKYKELDKKDLKESKKLLKKEMKKMNG